MKQLFYVAFVFGLLCFPNSLPAEVITQFASADSMVQAANPNANFGTLNRMRIGSANDPATGDHPSGVKRGLVRFDVSSLGTNDQILDVTFSAFQTDNPSVGSGFRIYEVVESWQENSVTWNSQPAIGEYLGFMPALPSAYCNLNSPELTQLVADWVDGTRENNGLAIYFHNESFNGAAGLMGDTLSSRETANAPLLHITAVPEPGSFAALGVVTSAAIAARMRRKRRVPSAAHS